MDLSKTAKIILITASCVILTFAAGYTSLRIFRIDDPKACISEEKTNIPHMKGVGVEVVYTNCDTLAKDEAISIYFWRSGVTNDHRALVFRYDPSRYDSPLPAITRPSPSDSDLSSRGVLDRISESELARHLSRLSNWKSAVSCHREVGILFTESYSEGRLAKKSPSHSWTFRSVHTHLVHNQPHGISYCESVQKTLMDRKSPWFPWESAVHQPEVRFDIRAERAEYERLFRHKARVLQDRMVRRSRTDRTKKHAVPEWERVYQTEAQQYRLQYQARVLGWGKEKRYYFAHKQS